MKLQLKDERFSVKVIVAETLRDHWCTIEMGETRDTLHFKDHGISIVLDGQEQPPQDTKVPVVLNEQLLVSLFSEMEAMVRVPKSATSQTCIVEGDKQQCSAVMVARTVVTQSGTSMPLRLLNWRRLMDMVLARVQWFNCLVYLDNLIIVGQTFQPTLSTESEGSVHLPEKCRTQAQTQ